MSNTLSAAATGLPGLSRRGFARSSVAALAAAAVSPLAAAAAPVSVGGTMVALHAAYTEAVARVNALPDETPQAEVDRLWRKGVDIVELAYVAPIETPADAAAGIRVYSAITEGSEPNDDDVAFLKRVADRLAELAQSGDL